jgi:tetratricopeptide (TPR) repeat protein
METISRITAGLILALGVPMCSAEVRVEESTMTLPTYAPGPYDKNPVFYTGRVYQGAQGRVYPYPLQDVLHDEKKEKKYTALLLENEYLRMSLLPEIGGRLLSFTDKDSGFEIFYRQSVIKPALIGMLGAWTSGGVEWNFPHHHRATTFMPVDYTIRENDDGSKTVWIGETEIRHRMKWSIGLTMRPGRSYLEADCRFMNRQSYIESMLYWANVSVHCGEDYQVLFPPSCRIGMDHHKNYFTRFPMGRPNVAIDEIANLSWWKNFTSDHRSIFAVDPDNNFLAGYDHGLQMGTMHVANRHIVCGKKFFLWGNNPGGFVWDKVLTDHDGPYLELMVGAYSDNQPDYSWISPHETRSCKQYWYPIKKIGAVKNANLDAAINLERRAPDKVFLGFNTTADVDGAKVVLEYGDKVFSETIDIDPNTPYTKLVPIDADVEDPQITGILIGPNGRELVRYTPVVIEEQPLPELVENPKPPAEYKSVEELYLVGLRLEQFHNGIVDPMPYYREALRRDPFDLRVNTVVGIRLARQAKFAEAEEHLRRAVARTTRNHTRAKDAEPHYYLGLVLKEQGKFKEAEDELWKAVWRDGFQRAGYMELAQIRCIHGDYAHALEMIDNALDVGARSSKARTLKAYVLRKLGRAQETEAELDQAVKLDPLDVWSVAERCFLHGEPNSALEALTQDRGDRLQQFLEVVTDYGKIGATEEARALLSQADLAGESYANPLVLYYAGYHHQKQGDTETARALYRRAAALPTDYCFPFRHETLQVISAACELRPSDANTWYYLGNLCYYLEQRDRGTASWEKAVALEPSHGLALRNLGFAYGRIPEKRGLAIARYKAAINADPKNVASVIELDKLFEKTGHGADERLAFLESRMDTVRNSDPTMLRLAYLYNETGQYDRALEILTTRRFHVWEGAAALHQPFVDACLLRGLSRLASGNGQQALGDFRLADTYPENLQAGRPGDAGQGPKIYYYTAMAYRATSQPEKARAALHKALQGRVADGEMNYYRLLACRELGDKAGEAHQKQRLSAAIAALQEPEVIDAYAKFGGENTPKERVGHRSAETAYLQGLSALAERDLDEAKRRLGQALKERPGMIWAKYLIRSSVEG